MSSNSRPLRAGRVRHLLCGATAAALLAAGFAAPVAQAAALPQTPFLQAPPLAPAASTSTAPAVHGVTVDGVQVTVSSADYPATGGSFSPVAGDSVQTASAVSAGPFRYFSVTAVPYGQTLPKSSFPVSAAADTAAWRKAAGPATPGPVATLFGQQVTGLVLHEKDGANAFESVQWITEAGNRTWVVKAERAEAGLPAGFGSGVTLTASNLGAPTTVAVTSTAARQSASATATAGDPQITVGGGPLPPVTTGYWNHSPSGSTCDNYKTLLNTKIAGLQVCGYTTGSDDRATGWGSLEFECAELPLRYMAQRYGITGNDGGNGKDQADNAVKVLTQKFGGSRFVLRGNGLADHTAPQPGDIIAYYDSGNGHTGIVIASVVDSNGNGHIDMVDQNWNKVPGTPGEWDSIPVNNHMVQNVLGGSGDVHWEHDTKDDTAVTPAAVTSAGATSNGNGTFTFTAVASNASRVLYYLDGSTTAISYSDSGGKPANNDAPHYLAYDTVNGWATLATGSGFPVPKLADGAHTVTAAAFDAAKSWQIDSRMSFTINVNNAPPTPPPAPLPPAPTVTAPSYPVSGTVQLSASDSDPSVTSVEYFAGGTSIGTVGAPFHLNWDTTASGTVYGANTITAVAHNVSGASPASPGVGVYVNAPPLAGAATVKDANGTIHTFTLAKSAGELEETLVAPDGGTTWSCVSCNVGTPFGQGAPAAVIDRSGTIHVYTFARPYGELEETLLAPDGGTTWSCLTCNGGAETGQGTPAAVVDPAGTVHVYTLAASSGELDETLSAPDGGLTWTCLTCNGGAEPAKGSPSAVIDAGGNIHVYTLAISGFFNPGELDETRLPASGGISWSCLTCNGGAEAAIGAPSAVIGRNGTIHIYSLAAAGFFNPGELDETSSAPDGGVTWSCLTCNGGAEAAAGAPTALVDGGGAIHVYSYAVAGFFDSGELDETLIPAAGAVTWTCMTCNGGAPVGQGAPAATTDKAGAVHVFSVARPNGDLEDTWPGSGGWQFADRSAVPGTPLVGA